MPSKWYRASKYNNIYRALLYCYSLGILFFHNVKHSLYVKCNSLYVQYSMLPSHSIAFLSLLERTLNGVCLCVSEYFFCFFLHRLLFRLKLTSIYIYINTSRIMIKKFYCNHLIDTRCLHSRKVNSFKQEDSFQWNHRTQVKFSLRNANSWMEAAPFMWLDSFQNLHSILALGMCQPHVSHTELAPHLRSRGSMNSIYLRTNKSETFSTESTSISINIINSAFCKLMMSNVFKSSKYM